MAETKLKLRVEAEKDFMYLFDATGAYNRENNKYGWGLPNDLISNVTAAEYRVYLPKQDTYISIDVYPNLPNITNTGFEIIPSDLGVECFPPGVYRFDYVVTLTGNIIRTNSINFFNYQPLSCCISKKRGKTSLGDVKSDLAKKVIELELMLEDAIWAACAGNTKECQEISDYIESQCDCCC